ncbi:MAG: hypothetical protein K2L96_00990 [Muribaculaceae bacterium]|nr:hypothetical protein [Muribaculaceae bacterium]
MYNAVNKTYKTLLAAGVSLAIACGMTSCGPSAEENAAAALLGSAEAQYDLGEYQAAIDSVKALNERYRGYTDIRRSGLRIQALATEGLIKDSIEAIGPVLAQAQLDTDSLKKMFVHIDGAAAGMDGYYIAASLVASSAMSTTGIQPRVDEAGYLFLTANVNGRNIGLNGLTIKSGNEVWTSGTLSPARVLNVEGSDIASFAPEDLEGLWQWLRAHDASGLKGILTGSRGNSEFAINPQLRAAIIESGEYAQAQQSLRSASIQREKLERKLQAVRDQLANMPLPSED